MTTVREVEAAYEAGWDRLCARGELGGEHVHFLMPAAVHHARGVENPIPKCEELTPEERLAMRLLRSIPPSRTGPGSRRPRSHSDPHQKTSLFYRD